MSTTTAPNKAAQRLRQSLDEYEVPEGLMADLDAALRTERLRVVEQARAALSVDRHRLERSGRLMVGCSCGAYTGPDTGQSSSDAWRAHLLSALDTVAGLSGEEPT